MACARQMVVHGNVFVDGKRLDVPSAIIHVGAKITLSEKIYKNPVYLSTREKPTLDLPDFLAIEGENDKATGVVVSLPAPSDIPLELNVGYVIEYYGKVK